MFGVCWVQHPGTTCSTSSSCLSDGRQSSLLPTYSTQGLPALPPVCPRDVSPASCLYPFDCQTYISAGLPECIKSGTVCVTQNTTSDSLQDCQCVLIRVKFAALKTPHLLGPRSAKKYCNGREF